MIFEYQTPILLPIQCLNLTCLLNETNRKPQQFCLKIAQVASMKKFHQSKTTDTNGLSLWKMLHSIPQLKPHGQAFILFFVVSLPFRLNELVHSLIS